jgi:nucleotide-binding universal stress UspA family protein
MRRGEAWDYLLRVTKRLKDREFRVDPRLVHDEASTAKAILDYARNHDVDLIGLTTRGGGRWARLFRGSVADRVVRGASVPVLICAANTESDAASYERRNVAA